MPWIPALDLPTSLADALAVFRPLLDEILAGGLYWLVLGALWSKRSEPPTEPASRADDAEAPQWQRMLDVPLTGRRAALLEQILVSSREIRADVHMLPFESLKPAAQRVVDQQLRLIPEIEYDLHLAEWLSQRVTDLERRAAGEAPAQPRPLPPQSLMGIRPEVAAPEEPQPGSAAVPLDPQVQARLADIRERVATMDAEAERVARLLVECEANLLATISEHDERRLGELYAEFAEIFGSQYQVAREVNRIGREPAPGR